MKISKRKMIQLINWTIKKYKKLISNEIPADEESVGPHETCAFCCHQQNTKPIFTISNLEDDDREDFSDSVLDCETCPNRPHLYEEDRNTIWWKPCVYLPSIQNVVTIDGRDTEANKLRLAVLKEWKKWIKAYDQEEIYIEMLRVQQEVIDRELTKTWGKSS
jgi:hypothetical protein